MRPAKDAVIIHLLWLSGLPGGSGCNESSVHYSGWFHKPAPGISCLTGMGSFRRIGSADQG